MEDQKESDKTVYVGNLCSSVKEEILFELFLQAGPLKRVTIPKDHEGRQRSYGFVFYKHAEAVPYAIALLNGTWLNGLPIKLHYCSGSSYQDKDPGPQDTVNVCVDSSISTSRWNEGLSSVFLFGQPDRNLMSQHQACLWRNKVHFPLSFNPPQQHFYVPHSATPFLAHPAPTCHGWRPPQALCLSRGRRHMLPSSSLSSTPIDQQGEGKRAKATKLKKKHRARGKRLMKRCKNISTT